MHEGDKKIIWMKKEGKMERTAELAEGEGAAASSKKGW